METRKVTDIPARRYPSKNSKLNHRHSPHHRGKYMPSFQINGISEFTLIPSDGEYGQEPDCCQSVEIAGITRYYFDWVDSGDCTNVALAHFLELENIEDAVRMHRNALAAADADPEFLVTQPFTGGFAKRNHRQGHAMRGYYKLGFNRIPTNNIPLRAAIGIVNKGILDFSDVGHVAAFNDGQVVDINARGYGNVTSWLESRIRGIWVNSDVYTETHEIVTKHVYNIFGEDREVYPQVCEYTDCGCRRYADYDPTSDKGVQS